MLRLEAFSGDYAMLRQRFLAAAKAAGASLQAYSHALKGPNGEDLSTDVAVLGPADAKHTLVINSGTHGVEGAYGSACQTEFLKLLAKTGLAADTNIFFIHLINPWGTAWGRRVNEDNVDLNRNFIDWSKKAPANEDYAPLNSIFNIDMLSGPTRVIADKTFAHAEKKLGSERALMSVIEAGQYDFADGLFYGGKKPVWSNDTLRDILRRFVANAESVIVFDLHTGAGPFAYPALLSVSDVKHTGLDWGQSIFGPSLSVVMTGTNATTDTGIAATATGYVSAVVPQALAKCKVLPLVIECGTYPQASIFENLRADHWLHLHGDLKSAEAKRIKENLKESFIPNDESWREAVLTRSLSYFKQALDALAPKISARQIVVTSAVAKHDGAGVATVTVENLHKRFGDLHVLKGVDLIARPGSVISMIGASGSGKSTFLRCINMLEKPDSGSIAIEGETIRMKTLKDGSAAPADRLQVERIRSRVGMVFQNFNLWPHMTVLDNIIEAPIHVLKERRSDAIDHAHELLKKVGLSEKPNSYPSQLSGGQQQRAAIARTLAMRPRLMLFDEPTSALDPELVGEVLIVIRKLAEEGNTMILVTHEMQFAKEVSSQVLFLHQGRVEEAGHPNQIFSNPESERLRQFLARIM
jgi:octopine/nopaline transport system ATP-binding protein